MAHNVEAAVRGQQLVWGAPTYKQCMVGWKEMYHAVGQVATFKKSEMRVEFPHAGAVDFVSLDNPDNARGKTADGVTIDESGYIAEQAWYEVLRPMISDTGGWCLLLGTPKGRNWFWREAMAAVDDPTAAFFQAPTLGVAIVDGQLVRKPHPLENPYFPFDEAVKMYHEMPQKTFEQEFLAEFVEDAGMVFRNVRARCTAKPQHAPIEGHTYVGGIDLAQAYDFTVLSMFDATDKVQVALDRFNKIDYLFQEARIKAMHDLWRPRVWIPEYNSIGQPMVDLLRRDGIPVEPFTTDAKSKAMVIQLLSLALEQGQVTLLDDETQKNELEAYEAVRMPGGGIRYSAPEGMHDDIVMADCLGWYGAVGSGPLVLWEG